VRAHDLFATACDADSALACTLLADGYARGDGVAKDAKRAGELYAKGCKGGIARACKQAGK
jgi:TPR repeat protein